jgi:hypothetical protein
MRKALAAGVMAAVAGLAGYYSHCFTLGGRAGLVA